MIDTGGFLSHNRVAGQIAVTLADLTFVRSAVPYNIRRCPTNNSQVATFLQQCSYQYTANPLDTNGSSIQSITAYMAVIGLSIGLWSDGDPCPFCSSTRFLILILQNGTYDKCQIFFIELVHVQLTISEINAHLLFQ